MDLAAALALLANIAAASDAQLAEAEQAFAAWASEHGPTAEPAEATSVVEGIDAVRAEAASRFEAAGAADAARQALAARITPPAPPAADPPAAPAGEPAPPAEPAPAAAAFSAEDLTTAVTAAVSAALAAAPPAPAPAPTPSRASVRQMISPPNTDPAAGGAPVGRYASSIVAAANVPSKQQGEQFTSFDEIVEAACAKLDTLSAGSVDNITIAKITASADEEHTLGKDKAENAWKVRRALAPEKLVAGLESLMASGGLAAPTTPYYGQMVIAEPIRPVRDALETFMAPRGGIRTVLPPHIGDLQGVSPGTITDGATNSNTTVTSATAAFNGADVGSAISGAGIPAGTVINSVTNATTVVISQAATATATGVTLYIAKRNPNNLGPAVGLITVAQDAAGAIKTTADITPGGQVEYDVQSIYASTQYPNLGARAWPENVEANLRLALALQARAADSNLLDQIKAASVGQTLAATFGSARQVLAQLGHAAAYYRNHNRTDPQMPIEVLLPHWLIENMVGDNVSSLVFENDFYGVGYEEMVGFLRDRNLIVFAYIDSPGFNAGTATQLFAAASAGQPLPDYPMVAGHSVAQIGMFSPGSHLFLDAGVLDIGVYRDSGLIAANKFRTFAESFETSAYVGVESLWLTMTVKANGSYGAAATVADGAGSGL